MAWFGVVVNALVDVGPGCYTWMGSCLCLSAAGK